MMEMEQTRRRSILDEGCKNLHLSNSLPNLSKRYTGHLIVDDEYKILFNFIPKVSCKAWKGIFGTLLKTHKHDNIKSIKDAFLSAYTVDERQYRLQNYRKAVFVREPITRLLSAYLSKLRNLQRGQRIWEDAFGRRIVKLYRKVYTAMKIDEAVPESFLNITLAEFIQYITDMEKSITFNVLTDHFLPQNLVATPCAIHYDFIGHFENLTTEAPYMLKFLGVNHIVEYPPVYESAARNKLTDEYKKIPLDLMNRLRKYYHADYELFGYSFGDTLQNIVQGTIFDEEDNF